LEVAEAKALLEAGDGLAFRSSLAQASPTEASELALHGARLAAREGRANDADAAFRAILSGAHPDATKYAAGLALEDLYWTNATFLDADYEALVAELAPRGFLSARGDVAYRLGLIALRKRADVQEARTRFEAADGVAEERAACMLSLLDNVAAARSEQDQELLDARFAQFAARARGGASEIVNPVAAAYYVLVYAKSIRQAEPLVACRLCAAVASDPVFGHRAIEALGLMAELECGVADAAAQAKAEAAAHELLKTGLKLREADRIPEAIAEVDDLLATYPQTRIARDAALRRGYLLIAQGEAAQAEAAFDLALQRNADLGKSHPFNLEAAARIKQLRHRALYQSSGPLEVATAEERNQPRLDEVESAMSAWRDAVISTSPDAGRVRLEEAGIVFERASYLKSPEGWNATREVLREILDDPQADGECKAVAQLMVLESHYWERARDVVDAMAELICQRYPENHRVVGTALAYKMYAQMSLGQSQESVAATARRIFCEIPADAPNFPTMNYHVISARYLAEIARRGGDESLFAAYKAFCQANFPNDPYSNSPGRWQ